MSQSSQSQNEPAPSSAHESSSASELQEGPLVEFILTCRYTLTHAFSDEQYKHLAMLGPGFKTTLFSCPPGPNNPVWQYLKDILTNFWVHWPIEEDILVFVEFEEEKTLRSKEIVSMFVMALERRWSNPDLHLEGDARSVKCMFDLMWFLHNLIDEMFPELAEDAPVLGEGDSLPGLVEVHWM